VDKSAHGDADKRKAGRCRSKSDHAWRMAAQCAKLAQGVDEKDEREFYVRMRVLDHGGKLIRVP